MKKILISMLAIVTLITSCNVSKQVTGAYNLTRCEYSYNSIKKITLSGINITSGLSAFNILKATALLTGTSSSIPLRMTVNVNVKNPNSSAAILNGLQYILIIDDVEFTTGKIDQHLNIASGATSVLPINININLATLMKGDTKNTMVNIVKNLAGISSVKSKITLKLKPTFNIAGAAVISPIYYPVNFEFGGK